jgi:hypothetical protein
MNYQWVSSTGVSDFSQPIARLTVTTADSGQSTFASTINTITLNGALSMDTGNTQTLPMVELANLPTQAYSVTGTIYSQYNNGTSTFNTSYASAAAVSLAQATPLPATDMTYAVKGGASSSNLLLNLQPVTTPVTPASPNTTIKIDVVDNALVAGANNFSYNINIPNNASNVTFTPWAGVSNLVVVNKGGYLTVTGTYGAAAGAAAAPAAGAVAAPAAAAATAQTSLTTPTLGTLTATLSNMMTTSNGVVTGKGVGFSIDTATLNSAPATAQSLYFGAAETASNGTYTLSNLPLGQMTLNVYNNTSLTANKTSNIGINDAMSALSIAAGKGVVTSLTVGAVGNLAVSDFLAADWNQDGRVTAADSLAILQYFTNFSNLNSAPLSYRYFPSSQEGQVGVGKVTVTNAVMPSMTQITTNINAATLGTIGNGQPQTLDIIGVLQGDIVAA